jgi:transcriptional regulator with XRE-family HTH domain
MSTPTKTAKATISHDNLVAAAAQDDDFAQEWEELAVARAVAAKLISYRARNGLTQSALAEQLGMKQPQIARLELAEHQPSIPMLMRISSALGIEFNIAITPAEHEPKLLTKTARTKCVVASYERNETVVTFSAAAAG